MKMKFFLVSLLLALLIVGCDKDSLTEAILGDNSVEISGDLTDSFDANTMGGLLVQDSTSAFTVMMQSKEVSSDFGKTLVIGKEATTLPSVGKYDVDIDVNNTNSFHATYSLNDSTFYLMSSGSVEITTSSSSKIEGTFDMTGKLFDFLNLSDKTIRVKGKFNTVPVSL